MNEREQGSNGGGPQRHAGPQPWLNRNELTDLLAAAEDEEGDVLEDFPYLEREDIASKHTGA